MPPRNPARSLTGEPQLAERIGYERERRGWSYEQLAKRMTDVGCPMNQSAIYKIEKATPRRRITVDELLAFAKVFDTNISALLLGGIGDDAHAAKLLQKWDQAEEKAEAAQREVDAAREEFMRYAGADPKDMQRISQAASERPRTRRG
jgi:transcriptional regulator with XRE-family HTH domain